MVRNKAVFGLSGLALCGMLTSGGAQTPLITRIVNSAAIGRAARRDFHDGRAVSVCLWDVAGQSED